MTRLEWGTQPPMYDIGLDRGVLYFENDAVAWNGLVSISEKDTSEVTIDHYFDGQRVHISTIEGNFEADLSAYTYPDVFAEYNGYGERQDYRRFGFSFRTQRGPDDYQYHLVYGVRVRDGSRSWRTVSEKVDPSLFTWAIYGQPVDIPGASKASRLTLEAPRNKDLVAKLEDILYGTDTTNARLPSPEELVDLYETYTRLTITYHGDGSYTASGPDDMVEELPDGRIRLTSPSAQFLDEDIFVVNSY